MKEIIFGVLLVGFMAFVFIKGEELPFLVMIVTVITAMIIGLIRNYLRAGEIQSVDRPYTW